MMNVCGFMEVKSGSGLGVSGWYEEVKIQQGL